MTRILKPLYRNKGKRIDDSIKFDKEVNVNDIASSLLTEKVIPGTA